MANFILEIWIWNTQFVVLMIKLRRPNAAEQTSLCACFDFIGSMVRALKTSFAEKKSSFLNKNDK